MLKGIHHGLFAWFFLRILYLFMGIGGTAMIGTGLPLWSNKHQTKLLVSVAIAIPIGECTHDATQFWPQPGQDDWLMADFDLTTLAVDGVFAVFALRQKRRRGRHTSKHQ